jgi:hypothetical protein
MVSTYNGAGNLAKVLLIVIFGCLIVAALGGLLDRYWLAYFWYVALMGIASLALLTSTLAVGWLWGVIVYRYRRMSTNIKIHH